MLNHDEIHVIAQVNKVFERNFIPKHVQVKDLISFRFWFRFFKKHNSLQISVN